VHDHVADAAGDVARPALGRRGDAHDEIDAAVGRAGKIVDAFDRQAVCGYELHRRPAFDRVEQPGELVAMEADADLARGRGLGARGFAFQKFENGGGIARDARLDLYGGQVGSRKPVHNKPQHPTTYATVTARLTLVS